MAENNKNVSPSSKVEKATTKESTAAEKVAKAAKGSKKKDKPSIITRTSKGAKRFFKDFKGESKKIVWPDARTVLKSTGIVLLVVTIVSILVFAIDSGLNAGITGLENLANPTEATTTTVADDSKDDAEDEDTTTSAKADDAEDETEATTEEETTTTKEAAE